MRKRNVISFGLLFLLTEDLQAEDGGNSAPLKLVQIDRIFAKDFNAHLSWISTLYHLPGSSEPFRSLSYKGYSM